MAGMSGSEASPKSLKPRPTPRAMVLASGLTLALLATGIGLAARHGDFSMSAKSMKPMDDMNGTATPMNGMPMNKRGGAPTQRAGEMAPGSMRDQMKNGSGMTGRKGDARPKAPSSMKGMTMPMPKQ